ncbi:MAG: hypothetical protein IPJ97_12535 [Proteobacteria bacterium]|nr:hypothetical protein [Pseudomonadota bacterium]
MEISAADKSFAGPVPDIYERYMVPLMFEPYARNLVAHVKDSTPERVLELAAGTGVLTRALLATSLPATVTIMATDLNPQMLVQAQASARPVQSVATG